ncbi:MAG: SMC-Scp complex subunit ScpB [Patescibacteria group bacterium]|jgi:segregation and condensation protein B
MNELSAKIEAILFLSARPISFRKLASLLSVSDSVIRTGVEELMQARNQESSGIHVMVSDMAVELGSNPVFAPIVASLTKEELSSELTRPQLEALTIIAYRSPITKAGIEYIRGVNCSLILRNLSMRGLIIEKQDENALQPKYELSTEMLRHLGIHCIEELPDYQSLHHHAKIDEMLEAAFKNSL